MLRQVWSGQQQQEMVSNIVSVTWCGEPFYRPGVHDVECLILVDVLFLLDGGRRREGK
jgi:hypothetical protein